VSPTRNQDAVALDLLAVLATLFSRERIHPDRAADSGLLAASRGSVVQADLPADCQAALDAYNSRMLRVVSGMARAAAALVPVNDRYSVYLLYWYKRTSADAAAALVPVNDSLPLSRLCLNPSPGAPAPTACGPAALAHAAAAMPPPVCTPFAAISGAKCIYTFICNTLVA
jgi:hypothetical protein